MDDDIEIRKMAVKMIELLNCEVTTVPDGESAITVFTEEYSKGTPFDAVILDITIPGGVRGKETIKSLLDTDPSIKAVVSTGYSNSPLVAEYKKHEFAAVIKKPYTFDELVKTLSALFIS
jgi:DNA-binding NtrC family response regulator